MQGVVVWGQVAARRQGARKRYQPEEEKDMATVEKDAATVKDVVCGMEIDPNAEASWLEAN